MFVKQAQKKSKFYRPRLHWVGLILWGGFAAWFTFAFRGVASMPASYFRGEILLDQSNPFFTFIILLLMVSVWFVSCISLLFWLRELIVRWVDCVTLDWQHQRVYYRGEVIGRFKQIDTIYLRTVYAPKNKRYLSSILMKDGRQLWLEESTDLHAITKPLHKLATATSKSIEYME